MPSISLVHVYREIDRAIEREASAEFSSRLKQERTVRKLPEDYIVPKDVVHSIMKRRSASAPVTSRPRTYPSNEERDRARPVALLMVGKNPSLDVVVENSRAMLLQRTQ